MAIDFTLLQTTKTQMSVCEGDFVAWVLHSCLAIDDKALLNYCILVVPEDRHACLNELNALSADVPQKSCESTLEQWLARLSEADKCGDFTFCLDLPVFSRATSTKMNGLLKVIRRSLSLGQPWIYGISPNTRNWKTLPLDGIVQSDFNNSQTAGAQLFKFFAGLISPRAGACITNLDFEDVLGEPDNPSILIQATWNGDAEPPLKIAPEDLELLKSSSAIIGVSAGTPFDFAASRAATNYLWSLATHVELAHIMDHRGILHDPHAPVKADLRIHLLCRPLRRQKLHLPADDGVDGR